MIYRNKGGYIIRYEIGTCPNIEIVIDVFGTAQFFIRLYHVKEEDKQILNKEMRRPCHLGILKAGCFAYSSPVVFISRKLTKDKRYVSDFRDTNTRIVKTNLTFPLVRDVMHCSYC